MTEESLIAGSYRDPSGRVYRRDEAILRTVTARAVDDFEFAVSTGFLDDLVRQGRLVPWEEAASAEPLLAMPGVAKVLRHPALDFVSYPYEWSFGGLKEAALFHLEIQIEGLSRGVALSDASAYNVQFDGARPIFIDHLSFRRYREGEFWLGHRQFCEQFLNPLLLRALFGTQHNSWFRGTLEGIPASALAPLLRWRHRLSPRLLAHLVLPARFEKGVLGLSNREVGQTVKQARLKPAAYRNMLVSLRDWIEGMRPRDQGKGSVWSDYADSHSYSSKEVERKAAFVRHYASRVRPRVIWDIGCNTGDYSVAALEAGAGRSIGFEYDRGALEKAFMRARDQRLPFLPLFLDAANPSPAQGWGQVERFGLAERRNAQGVLALAVIHHLCIGRNVPLEAAVDWLVGLAPTGVIEYVPKQDPMVRELLELREDVFDDYSNAAFDQALAKRARVVADEVVTEHGRRLVWFERY